jgi:periplasmic divalent cation tolerance protein
MVAPDEALLVWTTLPDKKSASELAEQLVQSQLAACVHVLAGGESFYVWDGALQKEVEWTLLIKTRSSLYIELESRLKELHPYDLPEIIATPIIKGESGYLQWLAQSTKGS